MVISLKTKDHQFDNFVITGGTVSCHYDNLQCHQWQQSRQIDDLLFSVLWHVVAYSAAIRLVKYDPYLNSQTHTLYLIFAGMFWVLIGPWRDIPDSKVHGDNMGPAGGRQDPGGPHVGHTNLAIWDVFVIMGPHYIFIW